MTEPPKISYEEYQRMLLDPDVSEDQIARYVEIDPDNSRPFAPAVRANPEFVEMNPGELQAENALGFTNGLARLRRQKKFFLRKVAGSIKPVIVAEGDSWFQFPLLVQEVIDHLNDDYLVWCVSAAGDTARNMVFGPAGNGGNEYLHALRKQKDDVKCFLFSAAGNDIIGSDTDGQPVLAGLLKQRIPNGSAADHIRWGKLGEILYFLKTAYETVIETIGKEPGLEELPILVHGYDYAIPGGPGDPRKPKHAAPDQWLGRPLVSKGIDDPDLQQAIIRHLIDALYDMLKELEERFDNVHLVDVRGTLTSKQDWIDEIHGTSKSFAQVSKLFHKAIGDAIS